MNLSYHLTGWYNLPLQPPVAADSLHAMGKKKKREKEKNKRKKKERKGKVAIVLLEKDTRFTNKLFCSSWLLNTASEHLQPQGWIRFFWREWHWDLRAPFWFHAVFMQGPVLFFQQCYPWFPAAQLRLDSELMSFCVIHSSCTKLTNSWSPTCLEPAPIRRWNEAKQLYL